MSRRMRHEAKNHKELPLPQRETLAPCFLAPDSRTCFVLGNGDSVEASKVGIRRGAAASPSPNAPFQTVQDTFASYGFPTDHPEDLHVHLRSHSR